MKRKKYMTWISTVNCGRKCEEKLPRAKSSRTFNPDRSAVLQKHVEFRQTNFKALDICNCIWQCQKQNALREIC